ncbi:MAG: DNA polymerase III, subunit gamma and tau [Flavobacteriales bacterium]|nr:MAG: DNA polymerase III, subunit gamma and tau [Flavobacteriales bacterium]
MDQFVVSARKYRPTTFEDVVGQHQVVETLTHEINNNKLAQAFLFTGPRGVGKTTCARILAKVINTQDGGDPNQDYAFNIFELDAASNNSVEDIRHLIDQVRIPPQVGKYKVYIIDEVHMLSPQAFNAFLKTLEEPPAYAIFILATTEKYKILPTILSRCQIFNFNRIETKDMVSHLEGIAKKENINAELDALHLIARKADGGLRDALSMFDQMVSFGGGQITYDSAVDILSVLDLDTFFNVSSMLFQSHISDALLAYDAIVKKGFDGSTFLGGLASHFRNLAVSKETKTHSLLDVSDSFRAKYIEQSQQFSFAFVLNGLSLVSEAEEKYKSSRNPRLLVELLLMKLGHLQSFIQNIPSLEEVKKKLSNSEPLKSASFKNAPSIIEEKIKQVVSTVVGNEVIEVTKTAVATKNQEIESIQSKPILKPVKTPIQTKMENVELSGFQAFKRQKELKAKNNINQGQSDVIESVIGIAVTHTPVLIGQSVNPESGLTNNLTDVGISKKSVYQTLDEAYIGFYQTQSPRISTCMKSLNYRMNEGQLVIELSTSVQESIMEEIKPQFMQFLKARLISNPVENIGWEMGEIQVVKRRPYTDKEKLDYLVKKHPTLGEVLELLHLRLP